jgi:hypothetical protein
MFGFYSLCLQTSQLLLVGFQFDGYSSEAMCETYAAPSEPATEIWSLVSLLWTFVQQYAVWLEFWILSTFLGHEPLQ